MVRGRNEAIKRAMVSKTNKPGYCQLWTREIYGAPSVGDVDGDGRSNAVDGWLSEPEKWRHRNRKPIAGCPVAYSGGSNGDGHRAIYVGNGMIRTTDGDGKGNVATRPLNWPETEWKLTYLGWSESISGIYIPDDSPKPPAKPKTRGFRVDKAIKLLEETPAFVENRKGPRARAIREANKWLKKIKEW